MPEQDGTTGEVTRLLRTLAKGGSHAESRLLELLYNELRRIAGAHLRNERSDHTLTPTALVNEAWLRLANAQRGFENRRHFLAIAAKAMRRVLVDYARARNAGCRGGGQTPAPLEDYLNIHSTLTDNRILALEGALSRLETLSTRAAQVVEMRFFAGLTENEVASLLGVTRRTVNRDWEMARTWLYSELNETAG